MTTTTKEPMDVNSTDSLRVLRRSPRCATRGTWVNGTVGRYRFEALVFAVHATQASYELGDSRISKLWVADSETSKTVVNFDRGWDVRPECTEVSAIVDLLCQQLTNDVFGPM